MLNFLIIQMSAIPRYALFPYTTLFRSLGEVDDPAVRTGHHPPHGHGDEHRHRGEHRARQRPPERDRKSTRLNSSHVANSYAVFCLKKKIHLTNTVITNCIYVTEFKY